MPEVTLGPLAAAEALNIDVWTLKEQLRKAAVTKIGYIADQIKEPRRDRESLLDYFDEMVEETRRVLAAAEACDEQWWKELG